MIKLTAVYTQQSDGFWDSHIMERPDICVIRAEDLESARVILKIITSEEMELTSKVRRTQWDIIREEINYHKDFE